MGYECGKIYKLWSVEGDYIYIGSTINTLTKRLNSHKSVQKHKRDTYSYLLFEKYDNVQIELIENFACKDKNELTAREGYYIRINTCVNKVIPHRTKQEWYSDTIDHQVEIRKQYYDNNKEKIITKSKDYYDNNKDKISERSKDYYESNKGHILNRVKDYSEKNKDKISIRNKQYNEKNKDKKKLYDAEYREKNKDKIKPYRQRKKDTEETKK